MLCREVTRQASGLAVDNEIDVALAVQHHVFGAVFGHQRKAHFFKQRLDHTCHRGRKLDELETAQTHWVFKQISHEALQKLKTQTEINSVALCGRRADAPAGAAGKMNTDNENLNAHE
jgi:hypothetical protein